MDEPAISPIRKKRRSSIRVCADLVRQGEAQGMFSAGNTGAAMISAKMVMGTIEGVDRPALLAVMPTVSGSTLLLDVGANVDSKAEYLRQFAVMGHSYAEQILDRRSPRIGLLSIGERLGTLDHDVADKAVADNDVDRTGKHVSALDVAHEVE